VGPPEPVVPPVVEPPVVEPPVVEGPPPELVVPPVVLPVPVDVSPPRSLPGVVLLQAANATNKAVIAVAARGSVGLEMEEKLERKVIGFSLGSEKFWWGTILLSAARWHGR
jgi:hypothetical protein